MSAPLIDSTDHAADRCNDAWAITRCVGHANAERMFEDHGRATSSPEGLPDDLLEIAAFLRDIEDRVEEYLRTELDIDNALQHAQAALGLPVDEV